MPVVWRNSDDDIISGMTQIDIVLHLKNPCAFQNRSISSIPCIYVGHIDKTNVYVVLYVDDCQVHAENSETAELVIGMTANKFEITKGSCEDFVEFQIIQNGGNILLH